MLYLLKFPLIKRVSIIPVSLLVYTRLWAIQFFMTYMYTIGYYLVLVMVVWYGMVWYDMEEVFEVFEAECCV